MQESTGARIAPSPADASTYSNRTGGRGRWGSRWLTRTTHPSSTLSGWAEVCHPFHPLRGQRFPVLKTRRSSGRETLILHDPTGGTLIVRREWTDWAEPSPLSLARLPSRRFALEGLLELVKLVQRLRELDR